MLPTSERSANDSAAAVSQMDEITILSCVFSLSIKLPSFPRSGLGAVMLFRTFLMYVKTNDSATSRICTSDAGIEPAQPVNRENIKTFSAHILPQMSGDVGHFMHEEQRASARFSSGF